MKSSGNAVPLERPLPHSQQAERAVLGSIVLENRYIPEVAEVLRPDDFFSDQNRRLFAMILMMDRDGRAVDLVTLVDEAKARDELEAVGGPAYISSLIDGVPRVAHVGHYARVVKEKSSLRTMVYLGSALKERSLDAADPSAEVLSDTEKALDAVREGNELKDVAPVPLRQAVSEAVPLLERVAEGKGAVLGEPTGYNLLDDATAGWLPQDLVIIGGRPSMGKTSLALEFARRAAERGVPVMIFSLEMSRVSLVMRLASMMGRIDGHKLRSGHCAREDLQRLTTAVSQIADWPMWISDPSRLYSQELVYRVRHYAERYKLRLVIVDYLQLLRARAENRTQEITAVSRELKEAAKALGKLSGGTLIATAQLSRIAARDRPRLEDLRESGQIEQDADVVMFLWNRSKAAKGGQADPHEKWLGIAKQRNGPITSLPMVFMPAFTSFEQAAPDDWAEDEQRLPYRE